MSVFNHNDLQRKSNADKSRSAGSSVLSFVGNGGLTVNYQQTKVIHVSKDVFKKNRIIVSGGQTEFRSSYNMLRTHLLQRMKRNGWTTLGVTSAHPGDGKTLTTINLGLSIARDVSHTVLLADFDLARPSIHRYFGYEPSAGIGDYLFNSTPIQDILFNPGIDRVTVLPGTHPLENCSELLSSPKLLYLVEEMKNRYPSRMVLFDLPPVLACDDALAFSPYVDAILLVVQEGKTKKEDFRRVVEIIGKEKIAGTVMNKSKEAGAGYYY